MYSIFIRTVAGISGVGALWVLIEQTKEQGVLHALSYGRGVYDKEQRVKWDKNWDCRSPRIKENSKGEIGEGDGTVEKPTAVRHLILIRHGQYVMNTDDSDKKILTELGRKQAIATGKRLKEFNISYTVMHHSTMVRAIETAQLISESLPDVPMKSTDILCEGAPIEPEPAVGHWKPDHWKFFQDGARIETAFRQFFHRATPDQKEDSSELFVCHSNVIRYFVCRALQLPPEAWLRMSIGNCGITRITIRPNGRVSIKGLGDTGHLPPEMITFN